ncbi:MAG: hypothetical protein PHO07_18335, partial [Pirellulales bacterium]|nr:hypothetical protein [Pirellulales bacterium]
MGRGKHSCSPKTLAALMPMPAIKTTSGAPACSGGAARLTYSSRESSIDSGFGPGWSDADELPYLMGGEQNIVARFGSEQTVWFDAQGGGSYSARYGAKDALVHDSENNLFILTRSDGTRFEFFDYDQTSHPKGGLSRWVEAGGATIQVTAWTQAGSYYQQTQVIAEVVNKTTPNGQAHQKRTFTYWDSQSAGGRCGHVDTVTLSEYDTVYANYLGQAILTDLDDPASQSHTLTYNRYDADGRLILTAQPSSFVLSGGVYYDEDLPDLIDFAGGDSPYLSNAGGLFEITTYYASTSGGIDEDMAGGVKGYRRQTAVAHGEDAARLTVGAQGGPILLSTTTYYARTVGDVTIYPTASQTVYANEDGTGANTTEYAYTWYSGTFQVQEETTTLPAVPAGQNGSGASAVRKEWFDERGNLCWSMDELGRATYREHSALTGRLART